MTTQGAMKVVMTGSASDPLDWQQHIRNKPRREELAKRFKDAERPLQAGHRARHVADRLRCAVPAHDVRGQADARPRADAGHRPGEPRLQDKPGGLVVDYLGLADELQGRRWPITPRAAARARRPSTRKQAVAADAGEVRGLLRHLPRLRLVALGDGNPQRAALAAASGAGAHPGARRTAKSGC